MPNSGPVTLQGLQKWKDFHGLTNTEIAGAAGVSRPTVIAWFSGKSSPSIEVVRHLDDWKPGLWQQVGPGSESAQSAGRD